MRWLDSINGHELEQNSGEIVKNREVWHAAVHVVAESDMM